MATARGLAAGLAVAWFAVAAAGCGGGGGGGHYALQSTLSCLRQAGVAAKVDTGNNPLFADAPSIDADFNHFDIYIGFARDSSHARALASGVNAVGAVFKAKGEVVTHGNVAYYSNDTTLNPRAKQIVESCLSGATQSAKSDYHAFLSANPLPHYPSGFVSSFVNACAASPSASVSGCRCVIAKAEKRYTYDQFVALSKAVGDPTDPKYGDAQALIQTCNGSSAPAATTTTSPGGAVLSPSPGQTITLPPNAPQANAMEMVVKADPGSSLVTLSQFAIEVSGSDPTYAVVGFDGHLKTGDHQDVGGGAALLHYSGGTWKVLQSGSELEDCAILRAVRDELRINCRSGG